jgi:hypothetical protein
VVPGRLFRSASPEAASEEDAKVWLEDKNIHTWIDFRGKDEIRPNDLHSSYDTKLITKTGEIKDLSTATHRVGAKRVRYVVDMDFPGAIKRFFGRHATFFEKMCMLIAMFMLKWIWPAGVFYVVRMFYGRIGLQGLYLTFLEEAQPQLRRALELATMEEKGVLVNCMLGKDRTGTISALLLLAMGVPTERVCYDYSLTETFLPRDYISTLLKRIHLDSDEMASARKGTMQQTLAYLIIQYGSIEAYLDKIGFGESWRQKLRANFTQPIELN